MTLLHFFCRSRAPSTWSSRRRNLTANSESRAPRALSATPRPRWGWLDAPAPCSRGRLAILDRGRVKCTRIPHSLAETEGGLTSGSASQKRRDEILRGSQLRADRVAKL